MKYGVLFANTGASAEAEGAAALAETAEEAGFESLWTVEHVVVPAGYESRYPYSPDGRMPGTEEAPIPDPLVWLAYVAARTSRIKLATGILILPQRNPVVLAKEAATLDRLSGGRLILGVGVGWLREEFDALGVPWEARAARTEEYVAVLRALWREPEPSYSGRFVSFERAKLHPKPARPEGVPVVIGGHSEAAARRAGRIGDGFFPANASLDEVADLVAVMRRAATEAGRDPDAIEVTAGGPPDAEGARRLAEIGVHRMVVPGFRPDRLRRFAEEVVAAV